MPVVPYTPYTGEIGCFTIGYSGVGTEGPCFIPPGLVPALTKTILSYLYWEYRDDDDLQSFVDAYNTLTQEFVDWFNSLNLPIYTEGLVYGLLLDWVAAGVYGMVRPILGQGQHRSRGPIDTFTFNSLTFNGHQTLERVTYIPTTDDIFRRVLTWHFNKGDGKVFTIRWLKRRIMQFLTGENGVVIDPDQTYRISVTTGVGGQINITLLKYRTTVTRSALLNSFVFSSTAFNFVALFAIDLGPQFPLAAAFKAAVDDGVLELPFQFGPALVVVQ